MLPAPVSSSRPLRTRQALPIVFAACLVPRFAALLWFPADTSVYYYWEASDNVLAWGAYTEPLYPALLAVLRFVTGDRLTLVLVGQIAIAAFGGVLLYRLTERIAGRRGAGVAVVLYAFDPYLVRQSVSLVEITFCTTLLIAAAHVYARGDSIGDAALSATLLGLATLARFALLTSAIAFIGILLWRHRAWHAVAAAAAVAVTVGAWTLWTLTTNATVAPTRIGINLFVLTNEYAEQLPPTVNSDVLVPWAYDSIEAETPGGLSDSDRERVQDTILMRKALQFVRDHPWTAARLKARNLAVSLAPVLLPLDRKPRGAVATIEDGVVRVHGLERRPIGEHVVYSTSRVILLVGFVWGVFRRRPRHHAEALLGAIALSIIAVCTIFFPTSRLLAPMAFVMMAYAGVAARGSISTTPHPP